MIGPVELLRQDRKDELWLMCCGFADLSLEQFMVIQKRLLLEEIELLKSCELGRKVMGGAIPDTVEEFRKHVPLTTYADYCPELPERREDVLPAKVARWIRTSGYSGGHETKWVPWSERFAEECRKVLAGVILSAGCRERGDVSWLKEHLKVLYTVGSMDYGSGLMAYLGQQAINFDFLPSSGDELPFTDKIRTGFAEALYQGLDGFAGLPYVLVAVGEQIKQQSAKIDLGSLLAHPKALPRLAKGLIKSKLAHRPMLPKDLWSVKAIIGGGTDSAIFEERVEEMWGRRPLELYAGTEGGVYATQTWDYEGMTFVPNLNFFEFIPEEEHFKWQLDHSYQPKTVLLDEVKAGGNYEIVITNLHGGPLVRFRIGDMIRITSLRNEKLNIDIPQMIFYSRADDLIDIASLGRLTERIIWEAIENSSIPYVEWTARKEVNGDRAILRLYLELNDDRDASKEAIAIAVSQELEKLDSRYHYNPYKIYGTPNDFESAIDSKLIEVTLLPRGTFSHYVSQRQAEGADLGHLKPPHINPSDKILSLLSAERVAAVESEVASVR